MIAIINYGLGNVGAFANTYKRMNVPAKIASSEEDLSDATHIILPGVGAFDHALDLLNRSGMRSVLDQLVKEGRIPVLGVCVGMQIMAKGSDEGNAEGLGWINGYVRSFAGRPMSSRLPLPHMGWNDVYPISGCRLFDNLDGDARFYFLHSFYFSCEDQKNVAAYAEYGDKFACAVNSQNVYGVQFHPEKSHHWGASLLKSFSEI